MARVFYEVHSDCNENGVFQCFDSRGSKQAAVAYAKRHFDEMTWVDKVVEVDGEYEYCGAV